MTLPLIAALPKMGDGRPAQGGGRCSWTPEPTDEQIHAVVESVAEAGGLDYARERALRLAQQADARAGPAPALARARDALRASIAYVVDRRR